jgi:uncharacterized membrane protein YfcA
MRALTVVFNQRMHALLLGVVALWCFAVAVAGGTAGLVLGNIRLPVMLLAASSPAGGAGANIAVSGVAAAAAGVAHVRAGRIDWHLAAWLAPPSVVGAVAGGLVSGLLPSRLLLVVIGVTLLGFAADLLRPRRGLTPEPRDPQPRALIATGLGIGLLGGLVGLILGALRLPALLRMGTPVGKAVGTNLVVGVLVGAAGLLGHAPGGVDWTLLAVGAAASIPGALLGARLSGRIDPELLPRVVGGILVVAGTAMLVQAAAG